MKWCIILVIEAKRISGTFGEKTFPEGNRYVSIFTQREEKNHRGDDSTDNQKNQTRMYEMPG